MALKGHRCVPPKAPCQRRSWLGRQRRIVNPSRTSSSGAHWQEIRIQRPRKSKKRMQGRLSQPDKSQRPDLGPLEPCAMGDPVLATATREGQQIALTKSREHSKTTDPMCIPARTGQIKSVRPRSGLGRGRTAPNRISRRAAFARGRLARPDAPEGRHRGCQPPG